MGYTPSHSYTSHESSSTVDQAITVWPIPVYEYTKYHQSVRYSAKCSKRTSTLMGMVELRHDMVRTKQNIVVRGKRRKTVLPGRESNMMRYDVFRNQIILADGDK